VGLELKVWLVAIGAFFPVLIQTIYGTREVDPILRDTARCYGFSRMHIARYITTPSALPYVMTGARFAATASLLVVLAIELIVGSSGGLGYQINLAQNAGDIPAMYALVLATGIIGLLISWLFRAIENRSLHWHGLHREDGASA
jgi:ABC-type nitrate/sulfonate/bicarbonate transport system permease component